MSVTASDHPPRPCRTGVKLYAAACFIVGCLLWYVADQVTCGGDGGTPNAARGSATERYCDAHGHWLALGVPALVSLASIALKRTWARVVCLILGGLLALSPVLADALLPG